MRVLVVEGTQTLANAIARGLRREGMAVDVVYDGWSGLEAVAEPVYDVIVLDRDLPEVSGDDVCRALRQESSPSRVLMLTASGTTADLVEGLGLGADDYLSKPFRFAELVARIRALARRTGPTLPVQHRRGDPRGGHHPAQRGQRRAENLADRQGVGGLAGPGRG